MVNTTQLLLIKGFLAIIKTINKIYKIEFSDIGTARGWMNKLFPKHYDKL